MRRGKDRLRVTAQLIRASDGFHLWSETYDSSSDDVIAIQEDLAIEIAGVLEIAMDPEALADMVSAGTSSVPAYEACLEGLALRAQAAQTGGEAINLSQLAAFERAVEIDPQFASAHVELAAFWTAEMTFNNIGSQLTDLSPEEKMLRFRRHIGAAYELLQSYLEARPNDEDAAQQLINVHMRRGHWDEAVERLDHAVDLNRDDPQPMNWLIAIHVFAGDYSGAAELAKETVRRFPDNALVLYQAHRALIWNGDYDDARSLIPRLEARQLPHVNLAYVKLRQACADGDAAAAQAVMDELEGNYSDDNLWIPYHLTGQLDKVEAVMRPIHDSGQLYALSEFLNYSYFDPNPYPDLMKVVEREGIDRPDPVEMPFACQL